MCRCGRGSLDVFIKCETGPRVEQRSCQRGRELGNHLVRIRILLQFDRCGSQREAWRL